MDSLHIKPENRKVMAFTALYVVGAAVLVVIMFTTMQMFGVGIVELLDDLSEGFTVIGIEFNSGNVISMAIMMAIFATVFAFIYQYIRYLGKSYEFSDDKMIIPKGDEINYMDVVRIYYSKDSLPENIFSYGSIIIEAGGVGIQNYKIPYVSHVEEKVQSLQEKVTQYKELVRKNETNRTFQRASSELN